VSAAPDGSSTVSGQTVRHFHAKVLDNASAQTLTFGALKVTVTCAGGVLDVNAATTTGTAFLFDQGAAAPGGQFGNQDLALGTGSTSEIVPNGSTSGNGTAAAVFPGDSIQTLNYGFANQNPDNANQCDFWGEAISG
jgi:hypothetical protein